MTIFEHAMVAIDGALAVGLDRRHGWQIVALAGLAAMLPDFDGLTIVAGVKLYAEAHRLWGHNLLVAGLLAAVVLGIAYQTDAATKIQRWLARHWRMFLTGGERAESPPRALGELCLWMVVGVAAAYSHLLMDALFSVGRNLPIWGVPLLWPFTSATWAYPLVPWGNIGATVILAASMFAMLRWRAWTQTIAAGALMAVVAYMAICGIYCRPGG
jgi:membrane-bound metal-dependent hydrolase YbcI (DUF457 family)